MSIVPSPAKVWRRSRRSRPADLRAARLIMQAAADRARWAGDPAILALAGPNARLVSVAKRRSRHTMPQDEINALLVREALAGNDVVRLKGGDPFIFGRGGEEAEACRAAGVPVEVVPGISAAIGAAAAAQIPLTHRAQAPHRQLRCGSVQGPDRAGLVRPCRQGPHAGDLHGPRHRRCDRRKADRRRPRAPMPVAVIENATRADHARAARPLAGLGELVARNNVKSPALIVIGEVAAEPN
jgi:uroporphyrin-III C-methyltransferase